MTIPQLIETLGPDAVLTSEADLLVYECDGLTHFRQRPAVVVLPRTTDEVARTVRLCTREGRPFVARGAGTGLSGGAIPPEGAILIVMTRMNRLLEVHPEDRLAVAQTGITNARLSEAVACHGLHFAPDPSSQSACTLGGNIAENAGGPHCLKYGNTTRHVLGLKVVLPDGDVVEMGGSHFVPPGFDLTGLFIGSEGTLGIATEATVRLTPLPESLETMLAPFPSVEAACRTVSEITAAGIIPSTLELMDRLAIQAVESSCLAAGYPVDSGAVLLVEVDGEPAQVADQARQVDEICRRNGALWVRAARDREERLRLWKGRKGVFGAMGRLAPDLYVMDAVVPRSRLADVLARVIAIGEEHQVKLSNIMHAGDGNLHPNISYDGRDSNETERAHAAGAAILRTCLEVGGVLSGEHGIGLEKRSFMNEMFAPADLDIMRRVRDAINPSGLLNPGKMLPEVARPIARQVT